VFIYLARPQQASVAGSVYQSPHCLVAVRCCGLLSRHAETSIVKAVDWTRHQSIAWTSQVLMNVAAINTSVLTFALSVAQHPLRAAMPKAALKSDSAAALGYCLNGLRLKLQDFACVESDMTAIVRRQSTLAVPRKGNAIEHAAWSTAPQTTVVIIWHFICLESRPF